MLALFAALALAQTPQHRLFKQPNLPRLSYAFFEAFPASGAGTTAACSTTTPTGARGEALTFTRTGNATCSKKGLASTGIADGDLVVLTGNVARVEPDADGVLGLRVEGSRTNSALQSQDFSSAAWSKFASGDGTVPTVTADYAIAPDGTLSAERVQFSATTLTGRSLVFQATTAANEIASVYVKGNGTSGVIDVALDLSSSGNACGCAFNPNTWTRCVTTTAKQGSFTIGNDGSSTACGSGTRQALDVLLWQGQREIGNYATSPIPTTSAAVTRNIESASFTVAATGPTASIATSVQFASTAVGAVNFMALGSTAGANMTLYRTSDTAAGYQIGSITSAPTVPSMGTAMHRSALADNAGTRSAFWDGVSVAAPAASMSGSATDVWVGRNVSGTPVDGIVSRLCVDPDPSRCR